MLDAGVAGAPFGVEGTDELELGGEVSVFEVGALIGVPLVQGVLGNGVCGAKGLEGVCGLGA